MQAGRSHGARTLVRSYARPCVDGSGSASGPCAAMPSSGEPLEPFSPSTLNSETWRRCGSGTVSRLHAAGAAAGGRVDL